MVVAKSSTTTPLITVFTLTLLLLELATTWPLIMVTPPLETRVSMWFSTCDVFASALPHANPALTSAAKTTDGTRIFFLCSWCITSAKQEPGFRPCRRLLRRAAHLSVSVLVANNAGYRVTDHVDDSRSQVSDASNDYSANAASTTCCAIAAVAG